MEKIRNVLFGGYNSEFFKSHREQIRERNYITVKYISFLSVVFGALLVILSMFMDSIKHNSFMYIEFTIRGLVLLLWVLLIGNKNKEIAYSTLFLIFGNIYAFAIAIGTYSSPHIGATTFMVLLVALPILIINEPWRMCAFLGAVTASFIVCVVVFKSPEAQTLDILNAVLFLLVGLICNYHVSRLSLDAIRSNAVLVEQSSTDGLTTLMNRESAKNAIEAYLMTNTAPAAIMVIDIDNFKEVNDTLGHQFGDMVLVEISGSLKSLFRSSDVVSRLGGDEFIIFLKNIPGKEWVEEKAKLITKVSKRDVSDGEKFCSVSCSIGVALVPDDGNSYPLLYKKADEALYNVKRVKKGGYAFYNSESEG